MPKHSKVLFLKGASQYDVLGDSLEAIAASLSGFLERQGYNIVILDCTKSEDLYLMAEYLNEDSAALVFSFNAIGLNLETNDKKRVYEIAQVPIITYLVDNPFYHLVRLAIDNNNLTVASFDRENVEVLSQYFKNVRQVKFIPFFGFEAKNIVPYKRRSIPVLFVGTYTDPRKVMLEIENLEGVFKTVAIKMINMLLLNTELSLEKALKKYLEQINFEVSEDEFVELLCGILQVDQYIRNYFRDKVVRTVLEAGIPIYVYGNGWDDLKEEYPEKVIILKQTEAHLMAGIELMGDAKIVLSVMPWFKDCIQDRVISTMLNGAVSVTDTSKYMIENLTDKEEIVFYSLDEIERLPEKILKILEDDNNAARIAENGRIKAKENYTKEIFCEQLLELIPRKN